MRVCVFLSNGLSHARWSIYRLEGWFEHPIENEGGRGKKNKKKKPRAIAHTCNGTCDDRYLLSQLLVTHWNTPAPPFFRGLSLLLISFYRSIESNRFPPNCWYSTRCTLLRLEWGNNEPTTIPPTAVGISNRRPNGISVTASVFFFSIHILNFRKKNKRRFPFNKRSLNENSFARTWRCCRPWHECVMHCRPS